MTKGETILKTDMDERLEVLSDKVRKGIPIGFSEALEVIEYQERLRSERDAKRSKTFAGRLIRWFRYGK